MQFMNGSGSGHVTSSIMAHGFPEPRGYSVLVASVPGGWSIDIVFGSCMG